MIIYDCEYRKENKCNCGIYDGMLCTLEDAIRNNPENYDELYGMAAVQTCFCYKPIINTKV